jgi:uncharacterized protein
MDEIKQKAVITYPCRWTYKVIGEDRKALAQAISALMQDCACSVTPSHSSATGKYHSLNVEVTVDCEEKRLAIYEALKADRAIKIVL